MQKNDGEYVTADTGGYQILLNYQGASDRFKTISITQVLKAQVPADWVQGRIVLIGVATPSIDNYFYTPFDSN